MLSTTVESSPAESKLDLEVQERRARRFWVGLVVTLLGTQVVIGVFSIYLSVGDPSVAVIPNYYNSAVNWDVTRRARELTRELKWQIAPSVSPSVDGERMIRVELVDSAGQAIHGIQVSGEAFHHARGSERHRLRFSEISDGVYVAPTRLTQAGLWQLRIRLEGDHGIAEHDQELLVE